MNLPEGVIVRPLTVHRDERGWLSEIFRAEWAAEFGAVQWNATATNANVLRGVHVHPAHADYLVVIAGRFSIGVSDMRPDSPTFRRGALISASGDAPAAISIPPGVAHGYLAHERSLYVYGVDAYFDPQDELGCHWSDAALGIPWPDVKPALSQRDAESGSVADLDALLAARGIRL